MNERVHVPQSQPKRLEGSVKLGYKLDCTNYSSFFPSSSDRKVFPASSPGYQPAERVRLRVGLVLEINMLQYKIVCPIDEGISVNSNRVIMI